MTKPKQLILLLSLFIVVGIAAVSTNVIINGSTPIASNPDDFSVYFSEVYVSEGEADIVIDSEKSFSFKSEFETVGEALVVSFEITNASLNYDAIVFFDCSHDEEYLTVNYGVYDNTIPASDSIGGAVVVILNKSYVGSQSLDRGISCTINASAAERTSQGSGSVATPVSLLYVGREISIGDEKFNIISFDDKSVTMLAKYNVGTDNKQNTSQTLVSFSDSVGWEYTPGPKDIDVQTWDGDTKTILNNYIGYLKADFGIDATGNLITISELGELGCTFPTDYNWGVGGWTCNNSEYKDWLVNGQYWWTRSAASSDSNIIWSIYNAGNMSINNYYNNSGVRPIITVTKETALALIKYKMYAIGEEVSIGDENFNVISQTLSTLTMLAQYNLGTDYRQNSEFNGVVFSEQSGWNYADYAYDIDIQQWAASPKLYVNNYVDYLKKVTGNASIGGNVITLYELGKLGCTVQDDYFYTGDESCESSGNYGWLINSQSMWVASVLPYDGDFVWSMDSVGKLNAGHFSDYNGIRPVITIDKSILE